VADVGAQDFVEKPLVPLGQVDQVHVLVQILVQPIQEGTAVLHLLISLPHHVGQQTMDTQLLTFLVCESQALKLVRI